MSITKEQQQALDDALVPREQHLRIGNTNYRLSTTFKPKEPTFQVALDICPKVPGHKFVDPPFEEEILLFMSDLSYPGNIKSLSKAQILWGMYHQKNINYVYLLWEYLVYQIENKVSKRNKDMYYPRFTKVIINHFMSQDQSIPRRNKVDWHMASDDPILTTMRFIPQHEVYKVRAILLDNLTLNMKESEVYKTYYAFATGKAIPKPKYVRRPTKEKTKHVPKAYADKESKLLLRWLDQERRSNLPKDWRLYLKLHCAHEGTDVKLGVPDNDDDTDNEDDDDQNDDNADNESDDDQDDDQNNDDDLGDELDKEETNEENEANELYKDLNVNMEGRDTEMIDAPHTIVQTTQVIEDYSCTDTDDFSEFKQTKQFAAVVSSIPGIVDTYLANKMNEAVKQLFNYSQTDSEMKLKPKMKINKLDDNIKKIIKD
ncbi:hypothetical protein Tco_0750980 [Tanacetum coccineum]|uniref:Uncharacterized protein n=1 Tax=Tanacetum coccineum TaxID=301880 RepID=A0ABQ4Z2R1_9ASTR